MKKIILFFSIAIALTTITSCKKEKLDREAIIGNYSSNITMNCDDGTSETYPNLQVSITASSAADNKVLLSVEGMTFTCTVSGSTVTLENKSQDGSDYSGSGQVYGNALTLNITDYNVPSTVTCVRYLTGTKQ
jgi:hypothetical protein